MAAITRFEDIQAWQQARKLVREIYALSADGPLKNDWGLKNQLCRAAVSSMSNVAEGFARKSDKEFARYLDIAKGSTVEVQSLLYVALDIGYVSVADFRCLYSMAEETVSLIGGFASYLRKNSRQPRNLGLRTPNPGLKGSGLRIPDSNT
jgi:four helix bundle protein